MWEHEWVTKLNVILKENEFLLLNPVGTVAVLLALATQSRFINDGANMAKYNEAVNMAFEITFTMTLEGVHTPRTCLLRSVGVVLYRSPDKYWNVEKEMKGWGLEKFPCLY